VLQALPHRLETSRQNGSAGKGTSLGAEGASGGLAAGNGFGGVLLGEQLKIKLSKDPKSHLQASNAMTFYLRTAGFGIECWLFLRDTMH
jgi:hypothetical protein